MTEQLRIERFPELEAAFDELADHRDSMHAAILSQAALEPGSDLPWLDDPRYTFQNSDGDSHFEGAYTPDVYSGYDTYEVRASRSDHQFVPIPGSDYSGYWSRIHADVNSMDFHGNRVYDLKITDAGLKQFARPWQEKDAEPLPGFVARTKFELGSDGILEFSKGGALAVVRQIMDGGSSRATEYKEISRGFEDLLEAIGASLLRTVDFIDITANPTISVRNSEKRVTGPREILTPDHVRQKS